MHDLAVIVVSYNHEAWLTPCLTTVFERSGDLDLDVVVVDSESTDGTAALISDSFPEARVVSCRNRGFGHANNRGLLTCQARYVLFLNPDTEIREGTLADLVSRLDERPDIGLASVRQVTADGILHPTMRRFPNALRALGEAIGSERFPRALGWLGPRVLDRRLYDQEVDCDWVTGAFMLVRAEALLGAGIFDERFFLGSEEVDLACRIKQAGWRVVHTPRLLVLHHVHAGQPLGERVEAQYAFARRQYAEKHFSPLHRASYLSLVRAGHRVRLIAGLLPGQDPGVRQASGRALRTLRGAEPLPYGVPPSHAVSALAADARAVVVPDVV
jgi:hypothetical protein